MYFYPIEKCPNKEPIIATAIPYNGPLGPRMRIVIHTIIGDTVVKVSTSRGIEINEEAIYNEIALQITDYISERNEELGI